MALICATLLLVSMSMTAFASNPSVQAGIVTGVEKAVDADGKAARISVVALSDTYKEQGDYIKVAANMKKELGNAYEEGMQVIDVKSLSAEGDVKTPVTVTFNVNGVKAGTRIVLLQYVDNAWKVVEATAGNGTVTATLNSLSPVAFIAKGVITSPSTGESMMTMVAIAAVVIGAVGLTTVSKKRA